MRRVHPEEILGMRYFTRELHDRSSGDDLADAKLAMQQFERNVDLYRAQLSLSRSRMSAATFAFFSEVNTHDSTLLHLRIGDDVWERHGAERYPLVNRRRVAACLTLRLDDGRKAAIHYRSVRKTIFDYPTGDPWYQRGHRIDDFMNHELTDSGDGYLAHEVLFSSGTIFRIEFEGVTCKLTGRRLSKTTTRTILV
jgi:hypothetical protein